jgi:hypothetical protein
MNEMEESYFQRGLLWGYAFGFGVAFIVFKILNQ